MLPGVQFWRQVHEVDVFRAIAAGDAKAIGAQTCDVIDPKKGKDGRAPC